jgi:hypothetical protein
MFRNHRFTYRLQMGLMFLFIAAIGLPSVFHQPIRAATPQTQPAELGFFGLNTYFSGLERINRDGEAGIATLIERGRAIGVPWAREEISWGNLERHGKGRWEWSHFDNRLTATANAGYGIMGMLLTTPAWARVADCDARRLRFASAGVVAEDYWCPPQSTRDFSDYVRAVVERYDGDGYADAPGSPRVAVWQIWNEPNAWETWPGSPAEYAALLEAGYAAAKAADPNAIVAVGGVYVFDGIWRDRVGHSDGLLFLDEAFAARPAAWASFDALAVHPYMPDVAPDQPGLYAAVNFWGRLSTTRTWLTQRTGQYGGVPKPIWISEVGWSTCGPLEPDCYTLTNTPATLASDTSTLEPTVFRGPSATGPSEADLQAGTGNLEGLVGKNEQQQADYLVRAHVIALALGIDHLNWFQLEDKFDGSSRNFWEEAAILHTADRGYAFKPAATAYATLIRLLDEARFTGFGPLHSYTHTPNRTTPAARYHMRFDTSDNHRIDILWRTGGSETVQFTTEPGYRVERLSRDGAVTVLTPVNGTIQLTLGETPIYVRQGVPPQLNVGPPGLTAIVAMTEPDQVLAVQIANGGSGSLDWEAELNSSWATLRTGSGRGFTSRLLVEIDAAGLAPGRYETTLTVSSNAGEARLPIQLLVRTDVEKRFFPWIPAP